MIEHRFHFNLVFFKRFWRIQKIIFPRKLAETSLLFCTLLLTALLGQILIYYVGLIPSKYYVFLGGKDLEGFLRHLLYSLLLIVAIVFVKGSGQYIQALFYISSRKFVTENLHKQYFREIFYYAVNVLDKYVDNPDQRITQDVDKMCYRYSLIIPTLIISPFTISYYTYTTWSRTGYLGPLCIVIFFIVSSVINKFLMSPVVHLVHQQQKMEGDFRFKHMMIRSNAESMAFFRAGGLEHGKCGGRFTKLVSVQQRLAFKEYLLNFSVNFAEYFGSILSYIILAIPIFGGKYDDLTDAELSGLISENAFLTIYLIYSFTQLIGLATDVTEVAGTTHRIAILLEKFDRLVPKEDDFECVHNDSNLTVFSTVSDEMTDDGKQVVFSLEKLSYSPPDVKEFLLKDLTLQITLGVDVLVTGDSGVGKSSLLRVINRLWTRSQGHIKTLLHQGAGGVIYLPQKPVFTDGSLRQQLTYPSLEPISATRDQEVVELLNDFGLSRILSRAETLDNPVTWNWSDVLSPGEMQRLCFIRLFYQKPRLAVLDEATSQVDEGMETLFYHRCKDLHITVFSIGHRPSLRAFHDVELHINKDSWSVNSINHQSQL